MIIIDKLSYSSRICDHSPNIKAFLAMASLCTTVAMSSYKVSIFILITMGGLAIYYSRASLHQYFHFFLHPFIFMLLSTATIAIYLSREPMDLFSLPIGNYYITMSQTSLIFAGRLMITALSAVSCLYFLILTTPMTALLGVLKNIHCPYIIIELMLLMYRFIFIILDMAEALTTSQKCRLGNKDYKTSLKSMGQMLSVLLVRSLKRANGIYDAMESRCYEGEIHVLSDYKKATKKEYMLVLVYILCLVIVIL